MASVVPIVDDLPSEVRSLVQKIAVQIGKIHKQAEKDAAVVQREADQRIETINDQAREKVQAQVEKALTELRPLLEAFAREGKFDEALTIRDQIRQLETVNWGVEEDPGNLVSYQTEVGKSFYFDVKGENYGMVWGTDVYTTDSALACAAIHAGVLRKGERKVIRVTIVRPPASFQGSRRNGVTSASYGPYPGAYRIG